MSDSIENAVYYGLLVRRLLTDRELDDLAFRLGAHFDIGPARQLDFLLRDICDVILPAKRAHPSDIFRSTPQARMNTRRRAINRMRESDEWNVEVRDDNTVSVDIVSGVSATFVAGSGIDFEGGIASAMYMRFVFTDTDEIDSFVAMMDQHPCRSTGLFGPQRVHLENTEIPQLQFA